MKKFTTETALAVITIDLEHSGRIPCTGISIAEQITFLNKAVNQTDEFNELQMIYTCCRKLDDVINKLEDFAGFRKLRPSLNNIFEALLLKQKRSKNKNVNFVNNIFNIFSISGRFNKFLYNNNL